MIDEESTNTYMNAWMPAASSAGPTPMMKQSAVTPIASPSVP